MPPSKIPAPTQVSKNPYGNRKAFGSTFPTGVALELGKRHLRGTTIILPVAFQKECRRVMVSHIPDLQTWFHSAPSRETLERLIETPSEFPVTQSISNTILRPSLEGSSYQLRMTGILLEDTRILPDLIVSEIPVIQEVDDIPIEPMEPLILQKELEITDDESMDGRDEDGDGRDEDERDEDGDGRDERDEDGDGRDDDETDDELTEKDHETSSVGSAESTGTVSRALERIQNRLDRVREDLEDLRRLKSRSKLNQKSKRILA